MPVLLERRLPAGSALRITAVSWPLTDDRYRSQEKDRFLETIANAAKALGICDLITTAGLSVETAPPVAEILELSNGSPVLFEVGSIHDRSWRLAYKDERQATSSVVREKQIIYAAKDDQSLLVDIIASGAGTITFSDADILLLLMICGENNALAARKNDLNSSVLRTASRMHRSSEPLARVLGGPWFVINPAHLPYRERIGGGLAKFMPIPQGGETMKRLVESGARFRDGTVAPVAFLHVNNFYKQCPKTIERRLFLFGDKDGRARKTADASASPSSIVSWKATTVEIRLDAKMSRVVTGSAAN